MAADNVAAIWELLEQVKDPEIPVLSLRDLGVLRNVENSAGKIVVTITPTYSGCPALDVMQEDISKVLTANGIVDVEVKTVLSPAWTTDWISTEGKQKLEKFGIAPPAGATLANRPERCPLCASSATSLISEYGSTACKAMYQCDDCKESFCYFKVI
ncbi:MAG: phenylacetate-CoA oxygenase subunit PaaJ [Gammaproteobacteria bacterium]|nr:phenylacetate-CoA oxygenase subunit PaaJ [Gammaproteobacteria bacterium]